MWNRADQRPTRARVSVLLILALVAITAAAEQHWAGPAMLIPVIAADMLRNSDMQQQLSAERTEKMKIVSQLDYRFGMREGAATVLHDHVDGTSTTESPAKSLSPLERLQQLKNKRAQMISESKPEAANEEPSSKIGIVVTVCKGDISWLKDLSCEKFDVWLYTKCENSTFTNALKELQKSSLPCAKIEPIENVGREGHVWLHHIVKYYKNLNPVTAFSQDNPENDEYWTGSWWSTEMHVQRLKDIMETQGKKLGFVPLTDEVQCVLRWGTGTHTCENDDWKNLCALYKLFTGREECKLWMTGYKGQFAVSKRRIQRAPVALYKNLLKWVAVEPQGFAKSCAADASSGRRGHTLERLWGVLFGCFHDAITPQLPLCLDTEDLADATLDSISTEQINAFPWGTFVNRIDDSLPEEVPQSVANSYKCPKEASKYEGVNEKSSADFADPIKLDERRWRELYMDVIRPT